MPTEATKPDRKRAGHANIRPGTTEAARRGRREQAARMRQIAMASILAGLRRGYNRTASLAAGRVAPGTFYDWLGDEAITVDLPERLDADGNVVAGPETLTFAEAVARAEAEGSLLYQETLRRAATEAERVYIYDREGNLLRETIKYDWRAAAWWLERSPSSRDDYAPPARVEVSGPGGTAMQVQHSGTVTFRPDERWLADYRAGLDALPPGVRQVIVDGQAEDVTDG